MRLGLRNLCLQMGNFPLLGKNLRSGHCGNVIQDPIANCKNRNQASIGTSSSRILSSTTWRSQETVTLVHVSMDLLKQFLNFCVHWDAHMSSLSNIRNSFNVVPQSNIGKKQTMSTNRKFGKFENIFWLRDANIAVAKLKAGAFWPPSLLPQTISDYPTNLVS